MLKKCWDEFGILVEAIIKDSTGTNLYQLKSKTKNGYQLDRNVNIHLYTQTNDSGPFLRCNFPRSPIKNNNGSNKTPLYA
jgi:hypothetical protein